MTDIPEISVIMPCYNAEKYIASAINCILAQTFENFEFIIINDGSSDKTDEIISGFSDDRIKYFNRTRMGIAGQLNFGISVSNTDIIARMDSDDLCLPDRLTIQYNFLKEHKDVSLLGTSFILIDESSNYISKKIQPETHDAIEFMMPVIASVLHATIMFYKEVVVQSGGYKENISFAEDHELFLRVLAAGYKMHNIQAPLYKYRSPNIIESREKLKLQDMNVYKNGLSYLNEKYKKLPGDKFNYYYRLGLLEYYRGSIPSSRRLLFKAIRIKPTGLNKIFRYLLISCLGDTIIKNLRSAGILNYLSLRINKYFGKDFHKIKN